jgi:hypothetical protein
MSGLLSFRKTDQGWAATMPTEMAQQAGVRENSLLVVHLKDGAISTEILPPITEETKQRVRESITKFKDAFDEMKRLGD